MGFATTIFFLILTNVALTEHRKRKENGQPGGCWYLLALGFGLFGLVGLMGLFLSV